MSPPVLLRRVNNAKMTVEGGTHLAALCDCAFFAIKDANGSNAVFLELVDEAVPSQDVPIFVRHWCKVEPLRDECAITEREPVRWGAEGQERPIAITLLESYWRAI